MTTSKRVALTGGAAAVEIVGAADNNHPGKHVSVQNVDATNVAQLGGPDLTAGAGFRLGPGATVQLNTQHGDSLYALSDLGVTLHVLVTGA